MSERKLTRATIPVCHSNDCHSEMTLQSCCGFGDSKYHCGNCKHMRGERGEYYCGLEGPGTVLYPEYPAEYCSPYVAKEEKIDE